MPVLDAGARGVGDLPRAGEFLLGLQGRGRECEAGEDDPDHDHAPIEMVTMARQAAGLSVRMPEAAGWSQAGARGLGCIPIR